MSDTTLSRAVTEATNFLTGIHADVKAMLASLESAMERAGWSPLPRRLSAPLSSTLQGDWLLRWCYRYFTPKGDGDHFDRLVSVSCNLGGYEEAGYDYATLLAAAVRFPAKTTADAVYGSWLSSFRTFQAVFGHPGVVVLARPDYAEFWPHACAAAAVGFPLCDLSSEPAVLTRLVQPLLAAEKELGGKP